MNSYSLQLIKPTRSIIKFLFSCGFMSVTLLSHFPFYNNGFTLFFSEKTLVLKEQPNHKVDSFCAAHQVFPLYSPPSLRYVHHYATSQTFL